MDQNTHPSTDAAPAPHRMQERGLGTRTLADFLTDGSVARLCAAARDVSGVEIRLVNADGRQIVPRDGRPPWGFRELNPAAGEPDPAAVTRAMRATPAGAATPIDDAHAVLPIYSGALPIAAIVYDQTNDDDGRVLALARNIAASTTERCTEEWQLRRRNNELSTLFEISTLFVTARSLEETLTAAIRAAASVLNADAGVIHLLEPDGAIRGDAAWGVSEEFKEAFAALPSPRAGDSRALGGGVVVIRDVRQDAPEGFAKLARGAGLAAMMSVGLRFGRHPLGVLRVFSTRPGTFDEDDQRMIQALGMQIAAAVQSAHREDRARAERQNQRHLKLAGDVQRRMLPTRFPTPPGVTIGARYEPALELGGDFYDVDDIGARFTFLVGDVVGKGIAAALLMASVRSMFRAQSRRLIKNDTVEEVMRRVNVALTNDTTPNEFATAFLGLMDPTTRELVYCNAGHEPALVFRPNPDRPGYRVIELETGGPLLGVNAEFDYQRATFQLEPGDTVLAFTDGVLEAMDFAKAKYGRERLHRSVADHLTQTPNIATQTLVEQVLWDVRRFSGLSGVADDITLFAMRLAPEPPGA